MADLAPQLLQDLELPAMARFDKATGPWTKRVPWLVPAGILWDGLGP
jgi:hypothetical protein